MPKTTTSTAAADAIDTTVNLTLTPDQSRELATALATQHELDWDYEHSAIYEDEDGYMYYVGKAECCGIALYSWFLVGEDEDGNTEIQAWAGDDYDTPECWLDQEQAELAIPGHPAFEEGK